MSRRRLDGGRPEIGPPTPTEPLDLDGSLIVPYRHADLNYGDVTEPGRRVAVAGGPPCHRGPGRPPMTEARWFEKVREARARVGRSMKNPGELAEAMGYVDDRAPRRWIAKYGLPPE